MVRVEGRRAAERAAAAKQGLEVAKARQAETEAGLRTSLANTEAALRESLAALEPERAALVLAQNTLESARKALEAERKARSEAGQEVLTLRGQVMGTEDMSARLREQAARQAEDLSTLENFRVSTYLFCFSLLVFSFSLFLNLSLFPQSWVER